MSAGFLGYDPVRVLQLRSRVIAAIDALAAVRSSDQAAGDAVAAARAARANLEESCLTLVERIVASDALLTWLSGLGGFDLAVAVLTPGEAATAHDLAELARAVVAHGEESDLRALNRALLGAASTPQVLVGMFVALGGDATAALLVRLGEPSDIEDEQLIVAASVRSALATASRHDAFPDAFGSALVNGFVARLDDELANPAAAMSFLFSAETFGREFMEDVTRRIVEQERASFPDVSGHPLWLPAYGSVLNTAFEHDDGDDHVAPGWMRSEDPMYAVLGALSRNGDAGRAVFTDEALARYLLVERLFEYDGLRAATTAVATAAAGPDVTPDASAELLADAAKVASAFVNYLGIRPHLFDRPLHPDASTAAATILGVHLFSVHNEVLSPGAMDNARGDTITISDRSRGLEATVAQFDDAALDVVSGLAVRHTDGLATVRAALDLYQRQEAAVVTALLASGVLTDSADLEDAMVEAGRLEAHFIEHAGHQAEMIGRAKDDWISFWIDLGSFSLSAGGGRIDSSQGTGALAVPVIGELLGPAAGVAKQLLATHEAAAERTAEQHAEAAADRLLHGWYRELQAAGVIDPDLPPNARDGDGVLVSWERFQELPDRDRDTVVNRITQHDGFHIDAWAVRDAIKVQQLEFYDALD